MDEALIKDIKDSMRIKHTKIDGQIVNDIEAALLDMKIKGGVQPYSDVEKKVIKKDALIKKAIELYCKGEEDYQGKGEKYKSSYEKLRDSLSLCGEYYE